MAIEAPGKLLRQENAQYQQENAQLKKQLNALMMIASVRQPNPEDPAYRDKQLKRKYDERNNPKRPTEGQLLGEKGGYLKDPETEEDISKPLQIRGMPPEINPKEHKRLQKQKKIRSIAEEGSTEGERQAGRGKLKDQTQLPNFLKTVINSKPKPQDALKILQYLPALTGGGLGQMASSRSLREHLKPGTKGLRDYDKLGGGRGIPEDDWLKLIRSAPKV